MGFSSVIGASSVIKPGVCTSTTRPSSPFDGQVIYETDTDLVKVWNGTTWDTVGPRTINNVASATVLTNEAGASTSYADFPTVGPSVTLTTGTSALVTICVAQLNNSGLINNVSFAVSGATTLAASDDRSCFLNGATGTLQVATALTIKVDGLTAGSNTFTMKYKVSGGTGYYRNRTITVMGL